MRREKEQNEKNFPAQQEKEEKEPWLSCPDENEERTEGHQE